MIYAKTTYGTPSFLQPNCYLTLQYNMAYVTEDLLRFSLTCRASTLDLYYRCYKYRCQCNVFFQQKQLHSKILDAQSTSSFGVHPLWMSTTSSSTLIVVLTVAEEANACEALSATKWALMNRIRNWVEHCCMLVSATAS